MDEIVHNFGLRLGWVATILTVVFTGSPLARAGEVPSIVTPMSTPLDAHAWAGIAPHPRLFLTGDRIAEIRQNAESDPVTRDLIALVKREADDALAANPISYVDGPGFMFNAMRSAQGRIFSWAMMYRLTGEKRYFAAARNELLLLAGLPNWCPRHFLDVGEASLASAVGLDWLYDDLSPDDRDQIARAIVENGLKPSLMVADKGGWVDADFNWNPVCHGGLSAAALAIAEREPALAKRIVDRAIANVPHAGATYAPDGTFPEGPSYWSYGTTFYVLMAEALRSSFHTDCGLLAAPGFLKSADFLTQVTGPTGKDFDYADYHERQAPEPVMLWYARELRRRDIAEPEIADLAHIARKDAPWLKTHHPNAAQRHLAMELIWWDPSLPAAPTETLPRQWVAGGHAPMAVFRSAWGDPRATFIAMKGGTPNGSHAHMDVGEFILEANGVRWAIDLGTESYGVMRAGKIDLWNYSQDSTRWSVFRNGPEGHNILRFDAQRQTIDGFATIQSLPESSDGTSAAVADLTSLYRGQAARVTREVQLHPDRSVTVINQWTGDGKACDVAIQWLTRATVTRTTDGFLLRQQGESLRLKVDSDGPWTTEIQDVSVPRDAQDSPNPGLSRIVIHVPTAATQARRLILHAIPGSPR